MLYPMRLKSLAFLLFLSLTVSSASGQEKDPPAFAYLLHCSGCHLETGAGDPPTIPDLRYDLGTLLDSPEGRSYVLRVPGVTDAPISAEEMTELMNWMVGFLYPDRTDFEPFTVEEIVAGREDPLYDPLRYRQQLMAELADSPPTLK